MIHTAAAEVLAVNLLFGGAAVATTEGAATLTIHTIAPKVAALRGVLLGAAGATTEAAVAGVIDAMATKVRARAAHRSPAILRQIRVGEHLKILE
jgi:hypothetical protein